jgi:hypothetical protein
MRTLQEQLRLPNIELDINDVPSVITVLVWLNENSFSWSAAAAASPDLFWQLSIFLELFKHLQIIEKQSVDLINWLYPASSFNV